MTFNTYHWWGCELGDADLESARDELASGSGDVDAFLTLLRSENTAAVGTALDHYHHAEAMRRHGLSNPFAEQEAEVLARAREILSRPPEPRAETGAEEEWADHASALLALQNLAVPEDSDLIASALQLAGTANAKDAAVSAAHAVLRRSPTPPWGLLDTLTAIVFDDSAPLDDRLGALKAFGDAEFKEAVDVLTRALGIAEFDLQAEAALALAGRHPVPHRDLVEMTVAAWPAVAPWPADAVRDALRDDSQEQGDES
ncbi:hypothetical protein ABZ442_02090 [Streptomyces triculaminicus]|uniref:hypothetical protein n=1 Tax=Streptomyces triculaminicus TaxID=2816232 RepID=UPI0033E66A7C